MEQETEVKLTQKELRILVNLIHSISYRLADADLVLPILKKLTAVVVPDEPEKPPLDAPVKVTPDGVSDKKVN